MHLPDNYFNNSIFNYLQRSKCPLARGAQCTQTAVSHVVMYTQPVWDHISTTNRHTKVRHAWVEKAHSCCLLPYSRTLSCTAANRQQLHRRATARSRAVGECRQPQTQPWLTQSGCQLTGEDSEWVRLRRGAGRQGGGVFPPEQLYWAGPGSLYRSAQLLPEGVKPSRVKQNTGPTLYGGRQAGRANPAKILTALFSPPLTTPVIRRAGSGYSKCRKVVLREDFLHNSPAKSLLLPATFRSCKKIRFDNFSILKKKSANNDFP